MKLSNKLKNITSDFIYSMAGLILMNGVIQLLLYPFLERKLGSDAFGSVLTMISIVSIMGTTFGSSANYSRMVSFSKGNDCNGDYNIFLLIIIVLSLPVSFISMIINNKNNILYCLIFFLLMAVTTLRYYSDVEFRMNLNYKRFFIYYFLISFGYILGVLIYPVIPLWMVSMLIGETLPVIYVFRKGTILSRPYFKKSSHFRDNMQSIFMLSVTYLISALVLNADRLLLNIFADSFSVTIFYAASLVGKMVSLISEPLNGVLIGYLTHYKGKLKSSFFALICISGILIGLLGNVICVGFSYIFVKIMYADIFNAVKPFFWLANCGQIFYFISNSLTVILLRFTQEKYQLYINIIYLIAFMLLAIPATIIWKIWGMAWTLMIVNIIKIIAVTIIGYRQLNTTKKSI